MENRGSIWFRLQEHSVTPPDELTGKVFHQLAADGCGRLGRLRDRSVTPPGHLFMKIRARIREGRGQRPRTGHILRSILPYAAALLLLSAGVWLLFRRTDTDRNGSVSLTRGAAPRVGSSEKGEVGTKVAGQGDSATAAHNPQAGPVAQGAGVGEPAGAAPRLTIGGHSIAIEANDLFASFIDYQYADVGNMIHDYGDQPMRIHIDQYADILLGPAMKKMIRDLYEVRDNGSPTRTARKTKERLEKWRAADSRRFDKGSANPLDPMDLGESLFPAFLSFGRKGNGGGRPDAMDDSAGRMAAGGSKGQDHDLTVSYTLGFQTRKSDNGPFAVYDGGIQTLFSSGTQARLRMVSLMRIESIFLQEDGKSILLEKESGKKIQKSFTAAEWSAYNRKYRGLQCRVTDDTAKMLGYPCKKAIVTLKDGRRITAWYTPDIVSPRGTLLQPELAGVPGLVLRYEYTCRRRTMIYMATSVSRKTINPNIFVH